MIDKFSRKIIGGHRGSPKKATENTLKSFDRAILDGADFIEFDVRKSKDNKLIVHHDASAAGHLLRNMKLSEIETLHEKTGYEIPTLEDTLRFCVNRIMIDVEIKEPDITYETMRLLLKYYSIENFIVSSFHDEVLKYLCENHPQVKKGLVFDLETDINLEKRILQLKPDFLIPNFLAFNTDAKNLCTKLGLRAIVWTVNNKDEITKFLEEPTVAGIISDKPELAISIYRPVRNT